MSEMTKKMPPFTELGRDLMADTKGRIHAQLLAEIKSKISAKEKEIAAGLPAEEKTRYDHEINMLNAAHRIVDLFWHSTHHKIH